MAESIPFSEVTAAKNSRIGSLRDAFEQIDVEDRASAPAAAPAPAEAEAHPHTLAEQVREEYARQLAQLSYDSEVLRERSQLDEARHIQLTSAILLAAVLVGMSVAYALSLPGYFAYYITACASPALFMLALVCATSAARTRTTPRFPVERPGVGENVDMHVTGLLARATAEKSAANSAREEVLHTATFCLYLACGVELLLLIIKVGIGA